MLSPRVTPFSRRPNEMKRVLVHAKLWQITSPWTVCPQLGTRNYSSGLALVTLYYFNTLNSLEAGRRRKGRRTPLTESVCGPIRPDGRGIASRRSTILTRTPNECLGSSHTFSPPSLSGGEPCDTEIMNCHGDNTPKFSARITYGLVRKRHSTIRRSPTPQTSLSTSFPSSIGLFQSNANLSYYIFAVFQLPDELILSILSHISPDPHLTGQYARFCVQYRMKISDSHQQRMKILHPLSRTCMAMRLRLLPWIWDHIQPSRCFYDTNGKRSISWKFATLARTVYADVSLATRVR